MTIIFTPCPNPDLIKICNCVSVSIERRIHQTTIPTDDGGGWQLYNTIEETLKLNPLGESSFETCDECPGETVFTQYFLDNPDKTPVDLISDPSMDSAIKNLINSSGGSTYFCHPNIPDKPRRSVNVAILWDTNTCAMSESVTDIPEKDLLLTPETILVKYIPGTQMLLSETNPDEYAKLVQEYEEKFDCNKGVCCVGFRMFESGKSYIDCVETSESKCTTDSMTELYNNRTVAGGPVIIDNVAFRTIGSCEEIDCKSIINIPEVLGTCCVIDYEFDDQLLTPNCVITTEEDCALARGFWEPPKPNGLGGTNPPSCYEQGVYVETVKTPNASGGYDITNSPVVTLGPRKCQDITVPPPGVTPDKRGACCYFVPSKTVPEELDNKTWHLNSKPSNCYIPPNAILTDLPDAYLGQVIEAPISLFASNDGSVMKLIFPYIDVLNLVYPPTDPNRNTKIAADFLIKNLGDGTDKYKVEVESIIRNTIILKTIKA